MKICLINNLYKPYIRGGAERVVERIASGLKQEGHDVFVISTKPSSPLTGGARGGKSSIDKDSNDSQKISRLPSLYYNLKKVTKVFRLFWHFGNIFNFVNYFKVKSILKKEKPDIVITHNLLGIGYLIPLVIKKLGIKHIHTLHDIQLLHPSGLMIYGEEGKINSLFAKVYAGICEKFFGSPDEVISPSKWLMDMHIERGFFEQSKRKVLPNPVVLEKDATPPSPPCQGGIYSFLYVGQIEEHKGILFLIDAFKKFNQKNKNSELIIAGDGSKLAQAKVKADDNESIKFLGHLSKIELEELMKEVNCLIVPSLCYENSPTVIYEAFQSGLPVLASNIGGIPELLEDCPDLLFEPANADDLISKVEWLVNNQQELDEIGGNGREFVEGFGVKSYIGKLLD